jgi:large subunit ribosomal protein L35
MKLRTHKTTAKRFDRSAGGKGKIRRTTLSNQHLRANKSKRQLSVSKEMADVSKGIARRVRKLLPYL